MKKSLKTIMFTACLFLIVLFLFEAGVRIWGYSGHYIYDPVYMPYKGQGDIPYIHKPNLVNAKGRGFAIFNTDSLGLRSKVSGYRYGAKEPNEYRIAITGDSVTFGEGVRKTGDTYCQVLEGIINERQNIVKARVFNYGVSGYSVKNMADTLKYRFPEVNPDLVIMAIIPSDFDLSRTGCVDKWGYTANRALSGFMPTDSLVKRMLRKAHSAYLLRDWRYYLVNRNRIVKYIPKSVISSSDDYVKQFATTAQERGLPYLVVLLPSHYSNEIYGELASRLKTDGIRYLDLSSIANEFTPQAFRAGKFDRHPSVAAHKRIAERLAQYIMENTLSQYKQN